MRTGPRALPTRLPLRATRILFRLVLAAMAWGAASPAAALPTAGPSLGLRQTPLMDEPGYGNVAAVPRASGDLLLASTRDGVEVRLAASPGGDPAGVYRAPGPVRAAAGWGDVAVLYQGPRGIAYLDVADPDAPTLASSLALPHDANGGAVLSGGACAAFSDSFLTFARLEAGRAQLLETIVFSDGRRIVRARAHGDSLLVVAARTGALPRLYLTVFRLPAGDSGSSRLVEWVYNARGATDADWDGRVAFVADGNAGIHSIDLATGAIVHTIPIVGGRFVRGVAAGAASVFAVGEANTLQRFARIGASAESLQATAAEVLELEPVSVAVIGLRAVVVTRDVVNVSEPDEPGQAQIEFPASSEAPVSPIAPVRRLGRARRAVASGGFVYVAAYSGGLRIYRAGGADTSLVGAVPPLGTGRAVDLALDTGRSRVYLASQSSGLEVIDVTDPAAPVRMGTLALPGLSGAVAIVDASTVAVARTVEGASPGVTIVDVTSPSAPAPRGAVNAPFIQSPRALAVRDTVLFVADDQLGVLSVGLTDLDAPATFGLPTGAAASDLDLQGDLMLVASRSRGLQVVDVLNPAAPVLRSEPFLPPILGVTRQGETAVACLGAGGVALVDLTQPSGAFVRSVVASAGTPRDAAWIGDTLLIAAGTSVERFLLAPVIPPSSSLTVTLDAASALARARIAWNMAPAAGQVGWNVFRDRGLATQGTPTPGGTRITESLLPPSAREATDEELVAGSEHRYRLEAVYGNGRVQTVAEGAIFVTSGPRLGRPYPNPFRADRGPVVVPYRVIVGGVSVTLRVVDVRGRLVREVTAMSPASGGFGEIRWDGRDRNGRNVPSGIYYLYVRGPGLDDARSVLHLR